jgi:hypothetical protein
MIPIMMINGYYDGEVKMLYSIMVKVMKGERVLELGPVFRGYPYLPSLRTCSWSGHLGLTIQLQAIWLWLDVVSGPLLVGCNLPGRRYMGV